MVTKRKNTMKNFDEVYFIVDKALELAFKGDFVLKFYTYLDGQGVKKKQIEEFIESSTADELSQQVLELEGYIKGGDKTLKEAYGHIPKPKARKIKNYLYGILEDAWRYSRDRRGGRKKRSK